MKPSNKLPHIKLILVKNITMRKEIILALLLWLLAEVVEHYSAFRVLESGQSVPDAPYFKPYDKVHENIVLL